MENFPLLPLLAIRKMKRIIQSIITCLAILLVASCQSNKRLTLLEQHELLKGDLQLPRNLDYGGFYSFIDPPYYATYKSDHFVFMEHNDQGLLRKLSIDDITVSRNIIVYMDASSQWTVLKDLFRDLNGRSFNKIHVAYDSDNDHGTSGGQTFVIQSTTSKKFENMWNLVILNDGSIIDLVSNAKYSSEDQLLREIGYNTEAILIKGTLDTTAGEVIDLFNSLPITSRNGKNRCFLNIK